MNWSSIELFWHLLYGCQPLSLRYPFYKDEFDLHNRRFQSWKLQQKQILNLEQEQELNVHQLPLSLLVKYILGINGLLLVLKLKLETLCRDQGTMHSGIQDFRGEDTGGFAGHLNRALDDKGMEFRILEGKILGVLQDIFIELWTTKVSLPSKTTDDSRQVNLSRSNSQQLWRIEEHHRRLLWEIS